jgi:hypothetical protein
MMVHGDGLQGTFHALGRSARPGSVIRTRVTSAGRSLPIMG